MMWDGLLFSILAYGALRGAHLGGRAVAVQLASFFITYLAVFSLGPVLAATLREHIESPPLLLSMLAVLLVYFTARQLLKLLFHAPEVDPAEEDSPPTPHPMPSKLRGAGFGLLQGSVVAAGVAVIGCLVLSLQQGGRLEIFPDAKSSVVLRQSDGLVELAMQRYTRGFGPTTRQLVDMTLRPDSEKVEAFLNGPLVARIGRSDAMHALVHNAEVRNLAAKKETVSLLTHPAFLRVVSLAVYELQNEAASLPSSI
jgi:hypothetical protein